MKKLAFYGGSFDPVHNGHMAVAAALLTNFRFDAFVFVPAFHAPHKTRLKPTSAFDRHAMLCLATQDHRSMQVSKMELELPEKPYSVETLARINEKHPDDEIFFVMGADSWMDIRTWREWEKVLSMANHIVMTRPDSEIDVSHVTEEVRARIVDLRGNRVSPSSTPQEKSIFITDLVNMDISATAIRHAIRSGEPWKDDVPPEVAIYIEKYQIYN